MTLTHSRNALVSYHYYRRYDLTKLSNLSLIGDSGAFSAMTQGQRITVAELAQWITTWRAHLKWAAALDVIGDPDATYRNYRTMRDDYGLDVVPTIHYGANPALLDRYAAEGVDLVGLGGMVGRPIPRQMRWLVSVFKYQAAHHPHMVFHGWGVSNMKVLQLPFYSVDTSGWASAYRYGRAVVRDPKVSRDYTFATDGRDVYRDRRVGQVLRRHYGVKPAQVAVSNASTRPAQIKVAHLALTVTERRFQRLHGPVRTPQYGVNTADPNRAVHAVDGSPEHLRAIHDLAGS